MGANQRLPYSLRDVIKNLKAFIHYLLIKKWWMLLVVVLAGASLGLLYYGMQKSKYKAITTFILEEKSSAGGIAGLASQFGINLGSLSGGGSMFSGDNILNILKSKKVVQSVLLSKAEGKGADSLTLADLYVEFSGLKKSWSKKPFLANIRFAKAADGVTPIQDSVLNVIHEALLKSNLTTERTSKQGSIIKVQVIAGNSYFARTLSERLVEEAARLYLEIKIGTSEANIRSLQQRSDSLQLLLNKKSFSAAASQPIDINPAMRTATVPAEIATRDKTVLATLYAEVTKNLEAGKLLLSQQTPVIQMLDKPAALLDDNKKGILFLTIVFSFLAGVLYAAISFFLYIFLGIGVQNKAIEEDK